MTYSFTLIISRPDVDEETAADRLYASGCGDGLFSVSNGKYSVDFDREADSLAEAVETATRDVESAGIGSKVLSVLSPGCLALITEDTRCRW